MYSSFNQSKHRKKDLVTMIQTACCRREKGLWRSLVVVQNLRMVWLWS
ncbi:hypothetical protein OIU76_008960 [Salix suchowensis]|nr:hypothetical protein OIU76_008960 [Salix suchowensis]